MPPSKWRTTRPGVLPSVTTLPTDGRSAMVTAAPERETSISRPVTAADVVADRDVDGRIPGNDSFVPSVLRQAERVSVRQPGELRGELVPLPDRGADGESEPQFGVPYDLTLDPAEMLDVEDDSLADEASHRCHDGDPARGHVEGLARIFLAARQHVAAQERDADALMPPAVDRTGSGMGLGTGAEGHCFRDRFRSINHRERALTTV